jgi:hypothetical protein
LNALPATVVVSPKFGLSLINACKTSEGIVAVLIPSWFKPAANEASFAASRGAICCVELLYTTGKLTWLPFISTKLKVACPLEASTCKPGLN